MKKYLLCLLVIFLISGVSANYIYGDIYLQKDGGVFFSVDTDVNLNFSGLDFEKGYLSGTTYKLLTFKNGKWNFSLDSGNYDQILLKVHFPTQVQDILFINIPNYFISFNKKEVNIIDQNTNLFILIEYTLEYDENYICFF